MPVSPAPSHPPLPDPPPSWLSVLLSICFCLILTFCLCRSAISTPSQATLASVVPTPGVPTATPSPQPSPTPTPTPYDYTQPVPLGEAVDQESWFADAVFIGDSRIDGFKLFSGVTPQADFLDYTGLTVFDIADEKALIRSGDHKISILEALGQEQYGKVYISLGLNELGYYDASGFAQVYGDIIDAVRDCQSSAAIYIQTIIPVNAAKCKANDIPYYITNDGVADYNAALAQMCAEKEVLRVDAPDALVDENGESAAEFSADGVHFKREGYGVWLDYLVTHTGN